MAALKVPRGTAPELATILEISQTLASARSFRSALGNVLGILRETYHAPSGAVTLLDEQSGELKIEAGFGIPSPHGTRLKYRVGEGITGRVMESGKAIVVPQASQEPLFLDRTGVLTGPRGAKRELSFLAVPLADGKTVGVLGITVPYEKTRDYDRDLTLLRVVAALLGPALRLDRLVEAEKKGLLDENKKLREELRDRYALQNLVGNSRPMEQVYEQVAQAAPANTTVLIRGESGTGKELIAHAIHYNSPRAGKPFIKVSCAALPEGLIESELFGHEAGAFTDARAQKKGRFELAHGGTLFLDEVGDLSPVTQVKLLRVLQERQFERLGGVQPVTVDVRLITATNQDLETAMARGAFREDLFYRLNVFTIFLPPLRERRPDILLLADHFVEKYASRHHKDVRRLSTTAIDMLMSYHWPGNVRELENCIERAVLVCDGGVVHAHHLPPSLQTAEVSGTLPRESLAAALAAHEKDLLLDGLKIARGNRAKAARILQTTERILNYKIKRHGLDPTRFRA